MAPKPDNTELPPTGEKGLKARLVLMARRLLERDGLDALTLRAAAREFGVSHMAPYRHFKDKGELLAAVAEQGFRELRGHMDGATATEGDPLASGIAYVNFALDNPALYKLMFGAGLASLASSPGLMAAGAEAFQRCLDASGATGRAQGAARRRPVR